MINEQTLKIYEEIKREYSKSEQNFIDKLQDFQSFIKENKVKIKDLFFKAIKETSVDKLDIIKLEKDYNILIYKILIKAGSGHIEYSYTFKRDNPAHTTGLHCIFFSKYYHLEDVMTEAEKDVVRSFMDIIDHYMILKDKIEHFNNKSQGYIDKKKYIKEVV